MGKRFIELLVVAVATALALAGIFLLGPVVARATAVFDRLESGVWYQRASLSLFVAMAVVSAAMVLFIMQRQSGPTTLWHAFWACGLVATVVSLYFGGWAFVGTTRFFLMLVVLVWWFIDVLIGFSPKGSGTAPPPVINLRNRLPYVEHSEQQRSAVRLQRGLLHLIVFAMFIGMSLAIGDFRIKLATLIMIAAILTASLARVVRRPFYPNTLSGRALIGGFGALNKRLDWYQLPTWLAVINLAALRETMRIRNLHGTNEIPVTNPAGLINGGRPPVGSPEDLFLRRDDGCFNDLANPSMGRGSTTSDASGDQMLHDKSHPGSRLGRNVPLESVFPNLPALMTPSPRQISQTLLARREFLPAPTLNLIAAAWIQFQVHDWFNHGEPVEANPFEVPLAADDAWRQEFGRMKVRRTRPDPTRSYDSEAAQVKAGATKPLPPTYVNSETHWWDASQIYGSSHAATERLRTLADGSRAPDGQLALDQSGNLPIDPSDPDGVALSGFVGNWWVGLSLLHNLFAKEHNAICVMLRQRYATWADDRIFETARMINAALMAKIHTVEWTPAILQHPALQIGMAANWWGLATKPITQTFGRLGPTEAFSGIPNSGVDHHAADYSLTEEFGSVYRLHPLMPDALRIVSLKDDAELVSEPLPGRVVGPERHLLTKDFDKSDLWYSFGIANPGAITVRNYPNFLRKLARTSALETQPETGRRRMIEETIDLAAIDILRDRERGVPRYNQFRRHFGLKPIDSFDNLENPQHPGLPEDLRKVYGSRNGQDNVEELDLMVGMFSEQPPEGFGFSDTAFRVFILMASRRLKSDRFIAQGFNAEVFTAEGVEWVNENSLLSVLKRHFPSLSGAIYGVGNAFVPWHSPRA